MYDYHCVDETTKAQKQEACFFQTVQPNESWQDKQAGKGTRENSPHMGGSAPFVLPNGFLILGAQPELSLNECVSVD